MRKLDTRLQNLYDDFDRASYNGYINHLHLDFTVEGPKEMVLDFDSMGKLIDPYKKVEELEEYIEVKYSELDIKNINVVDISGYCHFGIHISLKDEK